MILNLLLNTRMIWTIFTKILKNTIQIRDKKILIAFDDMITDMLSKKKCNPIITELFIRGRWLDIYLVIFITDSYFAVSKNIRPNPKHYFIMKIQSKQHLWEITFNYLSDNDFMSLSINVLQNHKHFLIIDATLPSYIFL